MQQTETKISGRVKTFVGFVYLPTLEYTGPVTNLAAFCRERNLDAQSMSDLAREQKITYRSWTLYRGESAEEQKRLRMLQKQYASSVNGKAKRWPGLVHEETGERTGTITNLQGWCTLRQLNYHCISSVQYGYQSVYRGWKLDPDWEK